MENRFNLIDEPWIPVVDIGMASLREIFAKPQYRALGGTPVQKIALTKLLLAIAQAAATPEDDAQWNEWGWQGMSRRVLGYLTQWHDRFFLYGERPFLQMPGIVAADVKSFGAVLPDVATGNTTVLTESQIQKSLNDADKALLLITLMGFALGGKKTDNRIVLSPDYLGKKNDKGKASTGRPGPSVLHMGLLHSFCQGDSLQKSIWLNVFSHAELANLTIFPGGLGRAPWEKMPEGEACPIALALKSSLMGRLITLSRFCLLRECGLHYSEGIAHDSYKDGIYDPSITVNPSGNDVKVLWANPEKRPWRELASLLGFITPQNSNHDCIQLRLSLSKSIRCNEAVAIWSGGLRVSFNAGEQYVSGTDDIVESLLWLVPGQLSEIWFLHFQQEMNALDSVGKSLYGSVMAYFKTQLMDGEKFAAQASNLFWQLCESHAQKLIDHCEHPNKKYELRSKFVRYVEQAFDLFCPNQTARQLDAWARTKPSFGKYLQRRMHEQSTTNDQPQKHIDSFVEYLIHRCAQDKGFAARLLRANNPATEFQSWETFAAFGVNLESAPEWQPFALIAAEVARCQKPTNGTLRLGKAIAHCFDHGNQSDQAKARLRRLLACDQMEELCRILRPLLSLIQSRVFQPLDYARLLSELRWFDRSAQKTKARWAQQFYGKTEDAEKEQS